MREVMARFIRTRHAQGYTFLLVSHDMPIVVDLCQRAVCMNAGRVIASGDIHSVLKDHNVIEAYLGNTDSGHEAPPSLEVH
jgi:branched-chain amino acid transport system ATP-binding protein